MMRRSVFLVAAAVLVGCGGSDSGTTAGGSGNTPAPSAAASDSLARWQTVIARMDGREITAEDIYFHLVQTMGEDRAKSTMTNPDMLQLAAGALLDQFVWARQAERDGFELTRSEKTRVDALGAEFLATRYLGDVIQHRADPSPEQIREWYENNQQFYLAPARVGVRHILVDDEQLARRLLAEAQGGADFTALVRAHSRDDLTRDINGALGFVEEGKEILGLGRNSAFANAVLPLQEGQMTVVETDRGWHVARVDRREGGGLKPLEEVREQIIEGWRRRNWSVVYNEELSNARESFDARMDPKGVERFTGIVQNVDRILEMAGMHPDASGRIELYRRVAFDFPDSEHAPRAQFMVAYLYLKELRDSYSASKALNRLRTTFPDSEWRRAGDWLAQYVDPDAKVPADTHQHAHEGEPEFEKLDLPAPEEILELSGR